MFQPDAHQIAPVSLAQLLADRARATPESAALHCGDATLSYAALNQAAGMLAAAFRDIGIAPGAIVAMAGRGQELLMGLLAAHSAGQAFLPLDPETAEVRWPQIRAGADHLLHRLPALPSPLPSALAPLSATPEAIALCIATSGSEGSPKGVLLPHRALLAAASASQAAIPLTNADTWLDCLPLTHIGGLVIFWRCFSAGAAVRLHEHFSAEAVWADIRDGRASHVSLVPAMLAQLLDAAADSAPPASLRCALIGGAALSRPLWERATAAGWPLHVCYGMSETSAQIAQLAPGDNWQEGRVGHPLQGVEINIGTNGRIQMRGPQRMLGYLGETQQSFDQWLTTGDLGQLDPNGVLSVLGRADDTLVSGGHNVHPAEIEAKLAHCPGISDAAVTRRSDPVWGDIVTALVVGTANAESVAAWCRASLPSLLRPRQIICVPTLPRNAMGKLERQRVAELLAACITEPPQ